MYSIEAKFVLREDQPRLRPNPLAEAGGAVACTGLLLAQPHQIGVPTPHTNLLPLHNTTIIPRLALLPQNQTMRVPMIALILFRTICTKRPMHLRTHIAKDAL